MHFFRTNKQVCNLCMLIWFEYLFRACSCCCGQENSEGHNGYNSNNPKAANKYPFIVAIKISYRTKYDTEQHIKYNTGTLVSDLFVVTAASIFNYDNPNDPDDPYNLDNHNPDNIEVIPGATSYANHLITDWKQIERIWVHPYYRRTRIEVPSSDLSYNVALLKLKTRLDFVSELSQTNGIRSDMLAMFHVYLPTMGSNSIFWYWKIFSYDKLCIYWSFWPCLGVFT